MKRNATAAHSDGRAAGAAQAPHRQAGRFGAALMQFPGQVVVGAGAVEHSQLVDLAGNAFGGLPAGGPSTEELVQKARRCAGLTNGLTRVQSRRPLCVCARRLHAPACLPGSDTRTPASMMRYVVLLLLAIRDALGCHQRLH